MSAPIALGAEETQAIVRELQRHFAQHLDQDLGRFDAEFLLDFFASRIGVRFYNRGLHDAQAILAARIDDLQDAILQLEKPAG